jgi:CRP/FNR family transcriptional regulator
MTAASFPRLFCREPREIHELQRMATRISVSPGEDIFQDDERAEFVFGLSAGVVRLFKMRQDGARQIVSLVLPGEFLEMPSVGKHTVSATAVDKVSLHRFRREPLEDYLLSNPKLMQLMVDFANRRLKMAKDAHDWQRVGRRKSPIFSHFVAQSISSPRQDSTLPTSTHDA